ncbi:response regulator [Flammeovirga sp. SJP92]|uniref:response regulator n=1 Tax=Flammeovirga sp. SJP92 TaxID=1775430 RepID=UPI00078957D9|nr:response regulator [Flammeovirga sp. SJP92]KXX71466.1 two-component system response regulator [Flammeovirga sp. SJP92]
MTTTILYADDDPEDRMLTEEAFEEAFAQKSNLSIQLQFVEDGEELMSYLQNNGKYNDNSKYPTPDLILLDLNMPKKDGRECLKEIKNNDHLKKIPVVVLTTSNDEEDVIKTYNLGVSSFITKPVTFESMVEVVESLNKYWFQVVRLPH